MINPAKQSKRRDELYNSVQTTYKTAQDVPSGIILLDSLKTLETDLQKRQILAPNTKDQMHPIWFTAETERNIFLWRSGFSLIDAEQFEFWIDINKLISKRLKQIESFDPENPFFNSLWGFSSGSPESLQGEREYLTCFREIITSIADHASALSAVTSLIYRELNTEANDRKIVILPG